MILKNKEFRQFDDNERNAFIKKHLPSITALANQLSSDPSTVDNLIQECVIYLLDYFAEKTYNHHGPRKLSIYMQTRLISHINHLLQNDRKEKDNEQDFLDRTYEPNKSDPLQKIINEETRQLVNSLIKNILKDERLDRLVRTRYGCQPIEELEEAGYILFDDEHHSVEEIRIWEGITRQGIHDLILKGVIKLRKSHVLREYFKGESPEIVSADHYGISTALIDGKYTKIINVSPDIDLLFLFNRSSVHNNKFSIKDFLNFIISKGVKKLKGFFPTDMGPTHVPFFILYDDFIKYKDEYMEMKENK